MSSFIIAVDGAAASGKGTLSSFLANHYGLFHLDTGAVFRALAFRLITFDIDETDLEKILNQVNQLSEKELLNPEIRTEKIAQLASRLSVHKEVRARFRSFCYQTVSEKLETFPGAVVEGRDVGTVIFPKALVKIYLDVSPEQRAKRRYLDYTEKGVPAEYQEILQAILERDTRDQTRAVDPLKPAPDAHIFQIDAEDKDTVAMRAIRLIDSLITDRREGHK